MGDWSSWPMNKEVYWPKDEKIIGVLGLGPVATADFLLRLNSRNMQKDWQYPRILLDSHSKIPSRGRYFSLGETDPVSYIKSAIEELSVRGADFVVIPCNTAHILYDRFASGLTVPVPNIIDITTLAALNRGVRNPLILSTSTTREKRLYDDSFSQYEINAAQFPKQQLITDGIEHVKQNMNYTDIFNSIYEIISLMPNIDSVIFGCTEVSVLMKQLQTKQEKYICIDSNQELADFCLDFVNTSSFDNRIRMSV